MTESEKLKATEEEWNAVKAYHEMLESKYLPETIECHFGLLNISDISDSDMQEFKKGIGESLWDSDSSYYHTDSEHIEVNNNDFSFTIITLKRRKHRE